MPVDTFTIRKRSVHGTMREVILDLGLDSAYVAGGEALTAAQVNLLMPEFGGGLAVTDISKVEFFAAEPGATSVFVLDRAAGKIKAMAGGAEATGNQAGAVRVRVAYDVGSGI